MERDILHCDMNNFFASVECRLNPELKKYPVAVCGSVEERHGIVHCEKRACKGAGSKDGGNGASAKSKCRGLLSYRRTLRNISSTAACEEDIRTVYGSYRAFRNGRMLA